MQNLSSNIIIPNVSPNDKRQYQYRQLCNGIKMLLIHDHTITKSACSISIGVGTLSDPNRSQGLAHFLQHMLFMGSDKYPSVNQFSAYINSNAGSDNAYTDDAQTNYYFEVETEAFETGVDMLIHFITSPLLSETCIQKQRQAVHEEFMNNLNDDSSRKWAILHELAKGQFSKFDIGNTQSLSGEYIREDLVKFHQNHYSSNIITTVLSSNMPIAQLEKYVPIFETIANKNVQPKIAEIPFDSSNLNKFIRVQSIKDQFILQFLWAVEHLRPLQKFHIDSYISHMLGHESQNSLFSILKEQGLATQLLSFEEHIANNSTLIGIEITLTQDGYEKYQSVFNLVLNYINSIKIQEHIFREITEKHCLEFIHQDRYDSLSYTSILASQLHYIPPRNILDHKILHQFNRQILQSFLKKLTPENLLVFLSSNQELKQPQVAKYFNVNYKVQKMLPFKPSRRKFKQLKRNEFLPVDVTLHIAEPNTPRYIRHNVTFLQDYNFKICKGQLQLMMHSPQDSVFRQIFVAWIEHRLKQFTYQAEVIGVELHYDHSSFVGINISGYSHSVLKLLTIFQDNLLNLHKTKKAESIFELVLEELEQKYENLLLESTEDVLQYFHSTLIQGQKEDSFHYTSILDKLKQYNFKTFQRNIARFWEKVRFQWVFVGNFRQNQVKYIVEIFQSKIHNNINTFLKDYPCLELKKDLIFELKLEDNQIQTSGVLQYYQYKKQSYRARIILEIIRQWIAQPYFNQLRTNQKLAYSLGVEVKNNRGILGLSFFLVSSNTQPGQILNKIKVFLDSFFANFIKMDETAFNKLKNSVLTHLTVPDTNLNDLATFVINQVKRRTRQFDRRQINRIKPQINSITLQQVFKEIKIITEKSLTIIVVAKCHKIQYEKHNMKSEDWQTIKTNNSFHSDYFKPQDVAIKQQLIKTMEVNKSDSSRRGKNK